MSMTVIQTPKGKLFDIYIKEHKPYKDSEVFEILIGIDPVSCNKVSHVGRILK